MAIFSNLKVLWISVIVLIILNLTTLGALWMTRTHTTLTKTVKREDTRGKYLKEKLKLSDDQVSKFSEIKMRQKEQLDQKFNEIGQLREKLMAMMQEKDFNDSALVITEKIGKIQSEIEELNYEHFRSLLNICDIDQKKTFVETMKKAFGNRHDRGYRQRK